MSTRVVVHDKIQDYEYELSQPIGQNFADDFKPQLTPKEMLELGIFGGVYLRDGAGEFPNNWFTNARFATDKRDENVNFFQINASQPLSVWQANGWIHPDDPRGWFQWYCRYYMGRRMPDEDRRQISRWKNMTRHIGQIKKHCAPGDLACRRKQRQALLHWAYDSRKI